MRKLGIEEPHALCEDGGLGSSFFHLNEEEARAELRRNEGRVGRSPGSRAEAARRAAWIADSTTRVHADQQGWRDEEAQQASRRFSLRGWAGASPPPRSRPISPDLARSRPISSDLVGSRRMSPGGSTPTPPARRRRSRCGRTSCAGCGPAASRSTPSTPAAYTRSTRALRSGAAAGRTGRAHPARWRRPICPRLAPPRAQAAPKRRRRRVHPSGASGAPRGSRVQSGRRRAAWRTRRAASGSATMASRGAAAGTRRSSTPSGRRARPRSGARGAARAPRRTSGRRGGTPRATWAAAGAISPELALSSP
jgi:hypothetical protein